MMDYFSFPNYIKKIFGAVILIFLLIIPIGLFFYRIFPIAPDKIIAGGDIYRFLFHQFSLFRNNLSQNLIPFWNPYNFSGIPILANPSAGSIFYPFNIILLIIPLNYAFTVFIIFHILMAALNMYWLQLKFHHDKLIAFSCAVIYSLSGFNAASITLGHIEKIAAYAWLPLFFGSVYLLTKKFSIKYFILSIMALSLQILTGLQMFAMFTIELVFLYVIYFSITKLIQTKNISHFFKYYFIFGLIVVFSLLLTSFQILPGYELAKNSIRDAGLPYSNSVRGSFPPYLFKLFIFPFSQGNPFTNNPPYMQPWPNMFEYTYFIGISTLIIIILYLGRQLIKSVVQKNLDRMTIFLIIALLFFIIMALGENTPVYKVIYDIFPVSRNFRIPARYMVIVLFLFILILGEALSQIRSNLLKILLFFIMYSEILYFGINFINPIYPPTYSNDQQLIQFLKNNIGEARVYPRYLSWWSDSSLFDLNTAANYNIPIINGYNPLILAKYNRFIELASQKPTLDESTSEFPLIYSNSSYLDFLNVKYIINLKNTDDINNDYSEKFNLVMSNPIYNLYENILYLNKYNLIYQIYTYTNDPEIDAAFKANLVDITKSIALKSQELERVSGININEFKSDICENKLNDQITIISENPNQIKLQIINHCNSFLSTSDAYYPGWRAKIDGKITPVLLSNIAFRSVYLPKGDHVVEFFYSPDIFYYGFGISLISIISLFFVSKYLQKHNFS